MSGVYATVLSYFVSEENLNGTNPLFRIKQHTDFDSLDGLIRTEPIDILSGEDTILTVGRHQDRDIVIPEYLRCISDLQLNIHYENNRLSLATPHQTTLGNSAFMNGSGRQILSRGSTCDPVHTNPLVIGLADYDGFNTITPKAIVMLQYCE